MIKLIRTDSGNSDFKFLTGLLDEVLKESDGDEHEFFAQFNKPETINYTVVAYENNIAAGCGAIRKYSGESAEIKRMFVKSEFRGKGFGKKILKELENWSEELGFSECILETGWKQTDAVGLYKNNGYEVIPNYGQYAGVELSVCMKKLI